MASPVRKRLRDSNDSIEDSQAVSSNSAGSSTATKNAFAVLLASSQQQQRQNAKKKKNQSSSSSSSSSSKQRKSSSTSSSSAIRFVSCPAGCGRHVSAHDVNRHLDQCITTRTATTNDGNTATTPPQTSSSYSPPIKIPPMISPSIVVANSSNSPNTTSTSQETKTHPTMVVVSPSQPTTHMELLEETNNSQPASSPNDKERAAAQTQQSSWPKSPSANDGTTMTISSDGFLPIARKQSKEQSLTTQTPASSLSRTTKRTLSKKDTKDTENQSTPTRTRTSISLSQQAQDQKDERIRIDNNDGQPEQTESSSSLKLCSTARGETSPTTAAAPASSSSQLFAHMMARSRQVFGGSKQQQQDEEECWFWYTPQGVSLHATALQQPATVPVWTATVKLRDGGPTVHLATSVPSANSSSSPADAMAAPNHHGRRRFVQNHSRLSVPVLKSILQKSMRRRKPLPSVRVALELADKSLGDLLRRLPIIMLEDSTLHPDMGIVVWLMMAHSKEYQPSTFSMEQVFRVVFETASCQWQDCFLDDANDARVAVVACFSTIMKELARHEYSSNDKVEARCTLLTCIWATLARASYGGMQGDVRMLHSFATLWYGRCQNEVISSDCNLSPPNVGTKKCVWSDVPRLLHQRSREQSTSRPSLFMDIFAKGIDSLRLGDMTVEGVDFHCSAVIDHLLRDEELVNLSSDLLILSNQTDFPESGQERREYLSKIWKTCMWHYSSGVNLRRPLFQKPADANSQPRQSKHENLWKSLAVTKAQSFQNRYIRDRLY